MTVKKLICYSEGDVEIVDHVPDGALQICKGPDSDLQKFVSAECVSGIFSGSVKPCIAAVNDLKHDGMAAVDALTDFCKKMSKKHADSSLVF